MIVRLAIAAACLALFATSVHAEEPPLTLRDMGSFYAGGRLVTVSGEPTREVAFTATGTPARIDPNGTYMVGQMYVQYFLPADQHGTVPMLMWHGGGLTGVTWETTPDGREGWRDWFLHRGWPVYVSDAVERGRAGWSDKLPGQPVFLTTANPYERFRIGEGTGSFNQDIAKRRPYSGSQFPAEGYDEFVKQTVPRWTTTDDMTVEAYLAEVDRVCPCVLVFHSQAGLFGFKVAQARPDKVKALVAIEPAAVPDIGQAAVLKDIPILVVYGDHIATDSRWPMMRKTGVDFVNAVKQAGGSVEVVDLPEHGIHGNSHMLMMERNNLQIAGLVQDWLAGKGLVK